MTAATRVAIACLLLLAAAARASGQEHGAERTHVVVSGFSQLQFNTTSVSATDAPDASSAELASSTFESRRVRLTLDAEVDGWIRGRIQPEFALGKLALGDAFLDLAVDPRFQLRIGQFKKPYSAAYLTGSTTMPLVERTLRVRGLEEAAAGVTTAGGAPLFAHSGSDLVLGEQQDILSANRLGSRDVGVAAHGAFGRLSYEAALLDGQGPDTRDANGAKELTGRLSLRPAAKLPLALGVSVDHNTLAVSGAGDREGTAYAADVEWGGFRHPGLNVLAEVDGGRDMVADAPFRAGQAWLFFYQPLHGARVEGIEPVARVSYGDPDTGRADDEGVLLTPGLNLYFSGRNRIMADWDFFLPGAASLENQNSFRVEAQVYF